MEQEKQGFHDNQPGQDSPALGRENRFEETGAERGDWEGYSLSTLSTFFENC
jgi:hypothetical protein